MTAGRLSALVDDYLRVVTRTRPWTRRLEEAVLTDFAKWAAGDPDHLRREPAAGWYTLASRYADGPELPAELRERRAEVLRGFAAWAEAEVGAGAVKLVTSGNTSERGDASGWSFDR